MLFHLLFISAVVCLSCAHHPFHDDHDEEATKIVGGRDATIYEFPWQVSVLNTNRGQPPTGGALISRYAVLTVAHAPTILQVDRVRIGSTYSDKGGYIRHIRRVVIHPNFNSSTGDNDIAIIILKNPVYYSRRVQPVALPRYRHDLAINATVTVSGWGWFDYDHGIHPEILQAGDARIIDQKACAGVYSELTENMFCAVGLNAGRFGPCRGDAGGPTVDRSGNHPVVHGLVSSGDGCTRLNAATIYTRVSRYVEWIRSIQNAVDN